MQIKKGTTRYCFLIGKFAIKFPKLRWVRFLQGILANIDENRYRGYLPNLYCPVRWCSWGGFILVMDRCYPLDERNYDYGAFERAFPNCDNKIENFGWHREHGIVLVDYSGTKYNCSNCDNK